MAQEMDTLVCDNLIDIGAFPEVAPPPLKGATCVLGQHYYLPQGQLIDTYAYIITITSDHYLQNIKSSLLTSKADYG